MTRHAPPIAATLLLLASCEADPQSNSDDTFKTAVAHWNNAHPVCVTWPDKLPVDIRAVGDETRRAAMNSLVEAGLLTATPISKQPDSFGSGGKSVAHVRYRPTPAGTSAIHPASNRFLGGTDFCYAKRRVVKLLSATAPGTLGAMQVVRVTYAWKLEPAPWASAPALRAAFPAIRTALDKPGGEATDTLVLTDKGWVNERAVGRSGQ